MSVSNCLGAWQGGRTSKRVISVCTNPKIGPQMLGTPARWLGFGCPFPPFAPFFWPKSPKKSTPKEVNPTRKRRGATHPRAQCRNSEEPRFRRKVLEPRPRFRALGGPGVVSVGVLICVEMKMHFSVGGCFFFSPPGWLFKGSRFHHLANEKAP